MPILWQDDSKPNQVPENRRMAALRAFAILFGVAIILIFAVVGMVITILVLWRAIS